MSSPVIAIVGPTASGKSGLALEIARRHGGEIICADSRTVYRGMDIGTAKPTAEERVAVPHHLLDVIDPGEPFTAADFKRQAMVAIEDISQRGKLPLLVGGTGLYIDAVLYDYQFPSTTTSTNRESLQRLTTEQLQQQVSDLGVTLNNSDWNNRPRLIRAIETAGQPRTRSQLRPNTLVLGLRIEPTELERRIRSRIADMLKHGWIEEIKALETRYGLESEALTSIGYRSFAAVGSGGTTIAAATDETVRDTLHLAKRQNTWFKRSTDIRWLATPAAAKPIVEQFLAEPL